MRTAVSKWGNSLALRLPRKLAVDAGLSEGTRVELRVADGALVVTPARPRYTLSELLAETRPEHAHGEVGWGPPRAEEAW